MMSVFVAAQRIAADDLGRPADISSADRPGLRPAALCAASRPPCAAFCRRCLLGRRTSVWPRRVRRAPSSRRRHFPFHRRLCLDKERRRESAAPCQSQRNVRLARNGGTATGSPGGGALKRDLLSEVTGDCGPDRIGQNRTGLGRAWPGWTGQDRTGQDRIG